MSVVASALGFWSSGIGVSGMGIPPSRTLKILNEAAPT